MTTDLAAAEIPATGLELLHAAVPGARLAGSTARAGS